MSSHLDNAVLRRYIDEPDALLSYEKAHLLQCVRCRHELEAIRENAAAAAQMLSLEAVPSDLGAARAAILARDSSNSDYPREQSVAARTSSWRWAGAVAALVAVMLFSYAPFRAYAASLLTIFQPRELTPISLTHADVTQMRNMLHLEELGTVNVSGSHKPHEFSSLADAERFAGETTLHPSYLPAELPHASRYEVSSPQSVRFTFDLPKAKANAARKHQTLPPAPAGIDGATLSTQVSPFVVQSYGLAPDRTNRERGAFPHNAIFIVQGRVPVFHSSGASLADVESYLLSLPNVPDDVKAQIRAIRNPSETMPVPIGMNQANGQTITVHGAQGLLIGDNTGVGSAVIWLADGKFYEVGGGFTADEITKVANSLTQ